VEENSVTPSTRPQDIFELLSAKSVAKIRAAKAEAKADLLPRLSAFWESLPVTPASLKRQIPAELIGLFEHYAERQLDAYAAEFLPHFSDANLYLWHLATDAVDRISNEIRPASVFFPPDRISGDWTEIVRMAREGDDADKLRQALANPSGDWEVYLGRTFARHLAKRTMPNARLLHGDGEKAVRALSMAFRLKYQFHLRLFLNWYSFDLRLRAHLSNRLAHWEAEAHRRLAALVGEPEAESQRLGPRLVVSADKADRRAAVDSFIAKAAEAGYKITRKDIWTVAGYKNPTEFERFQRADRRTTESAVANFTRVLRMKPEDFLQALQKKTQK
jgi:hypothetical protein